MCVCVCLQTRDPSRVQCACMHVTHTHDTIINMACAFMNVHTRVHAHRSMYGNLNLLTAYIDRMHMRSHTYIHTYIKPHKYIDAYLRKLAPIYDPREQLREHHKPRSHVVFQVADDRAYLVRTEVHVLDQAHDQRLASGLAARFCRDHLVKARECVLVDDL
jgi:hypothetical protein